MQPGGCSAQELKLCEVVLERQLEVRSEQINDILDDGTEKRLMLPRYSLELREEVSIQGRPYDAGTAELGTCCRTGAKDDQALSRLHGHLALRAARSGWTKSFHRIFDQLIVGSGARGGIGGMGGIGAIDAKGGKGGSRVSGVSGPNE